MSDSVLVWFRRDLRDMDHVALSEALRRGRCVFCVFVFDRTMLDALPSRSDRRVDFIHQSLLELDAALRQRGGALIVRHGAAVSEIPLVARELGVSAVFANGDYEPQAKWRDAAVAGALAGSGISFQLFKDQVIFAGTEVLSQAGRPYTVFTPYRNAWLKRLGEDDLVAYPTRGSFAGDALARGVPSLASLGFLSCDLHGLGLRTGMSGARQLLSGFSGRMPDYRIARDFPALNGGSSLSVHLRFGTVSIRELVRTAIAAGALRDVAGGAACWLSELIWRDFYFMILDHFPHVAERAFRAEYDDIQWEKGTWADAAFAAWCTGHTGYPLVDAAMRQLNRSGYMHNRLRMVTASFLCKDLGVDWRRGEAYFAAHLNDFDLAANNGGWQWASSSGCDAQPWFRIFNPVTQSTRFDSAGVFIRRYLPELAAVPERFIHAPWRMDEAAQAACAVHIGRDTPAPLVDHDIARRRTLSRYAVVRRRVAV